MRSDKISESHGETAFRHAIEILSVSNSMEEVCVCVCVCACVCE
jgi:hypothetical protein